MERYPRFLYSNQLYLLAYCVHVYLMCYVYMAHSFKQRAKVMGWVFVQWGSSNNEAAHNEDGRCVAHFSAVIRVHGNKKALTNGEPSDWNQIYKHSTPSSVIRLLTLLIGSIDLKICLMVL